MKRMNKKAQFFILAAVIMSAVIIGIVAVVNYADINKQPVDIYEISEEVNQEGGAILDYQIYNDIEGNENITTFVRAVAQDIRDKDPTTEFIFVYGDKDNLIIENYGSTYANKIPGANTELGSEVRLSIGGTPITIEQQETLADFSNAYIISYPNEDSDIILKEGDFFEVEIKGKIYKFPISNNRKIMFVIQKDIGDEVYVSAK